MTILKPCFNLGRRLKVASLVSGGVDSCVATMLLQRKGFDVVGVYMKNWEDDNGTEKNNCDEDRADAKFVCQKLDVDFKEVNFVKEYWHHVFEYLLKTYQAGKTPNPDIMCNEKIKLGHFINYALKDLQVDAIATGHYAGTSFGPFWENRTLNKDDDGVDLLRSADTARDQTFFLCRVNQGALKHIIFSLERFNKDQVRQLALQSGFERITKRKPSTGICFIGKKRFQAFIEDYLDAKPGLMVDIDTNEVIHEHRGFHYWTLGQHCTGFSREHKYFVAHKCLKTNKIYIAAGRDHPSLCSDTFVVDKIKWVNKAPHEVDYELEYECLFKFQQKDTPIGCSLSRTCDDKLQVRATKQCRSLTPGQFAVFYSGNKCIGSGEIVAVRNKILDRFI